MRHRLNVPRSARLAIVALVGLALVGASCSDDTASTTTTTTAEAALSGEVTVSAAASLTEAFEQIADEFTTAHPDVVIELNFGSSGQLAEQIEQGAPAGAAAFADTTPMDRLVTANLVEGQPVIFATNELVIVTKPGNPDGITGLADLTDVGVVSLCAESAPCGKFADQVLATAGVEIPATSVTRGQDVKATLAAVTDGDAVAAIVYATDASAAGDRVAAVELPAASNVVAEYPIAALVGAAAPDAAAAFVSFVTGPAAQAVLAEHGFGPAKP